MEEPTAPAGEERIPVFFRLTEWLGFFLLLLMGFLVPLFFVPVRYFTFHIADGILTAKNVLIVLIASGILICAAVTLLGPAWRRYRGLTLFATAAVGAFALWGLVAVFFSPVWQYSMQIWLPQGTAVAAALCGPLFLSSTRRVRFLLITAVASAALVALVGLTAVAGVRTLNENIYGEDPRTVVEKDIEAAAYRLQGGLRGSLLISTIGNPEYSGTYIAIVAAIAAVMILDWAPASRRKLLWQVVTLALLGLFFLFIFLSERRQPWVAISLAGLVRLLFYLDIPRKWAAAAFAAVLLALLLVGLKIAAVLAVVLLLAMFTYAQLRRNLSGRIRQANLLNRTLLLGGPILIVAMLIAFSTPGPWNPSGLRLLQRFGSLLDSSDQSYRERATMYLIASEIIWQNPVTGVAPGRYANQYTPALAEVAEEDPSGVAALARERMGVGIGDKPHNDYLQLAAEQGIPSLIFFLTAMIALLYGLSRIVQEGDQSQQLVSLALIVALVAFFSVMLTSFPLHVPTRAALFWSLVAASLGMISEHQQRLRLREEIP
jgi:hypothetical protein